MPSLADKRMKLRYAGACRLCATELPAKADAIYERSTKTVRCIECPTDPLAAAPEALRAADALPMPPSDVTTVAIAASVPPEELGVAGSSARREYERRRSKDEARIRDRWGRFGGLAVWLADEKQSTSAWERGAIGEERLGALLDALASDRIAVLHDRRIPGTRANIDHMAVTSAGIWVIDAKRYKGRPELRIEGGILRPREEKLMVARRDCTKLVDGVLKQVELLRAVVGDVSVTGALCFVEADWPLIGGTFTTRGVQVLWPRRLAKALVESEPLGVDVAAVRHLVATHFPPA